MNKKAKVLIGLILIGGILLSAGNLVFAQNTGDASIDSNKAAMTKQVPFAFRAGLHHFQKDSGMFLDADIISELIEKGIISGEQVDKIKEYIKQKIEQKRQENRQQRQQRMERVLRELVEKGTITEDKKDKILAYFNEKVAERLRERERIKSMTEEERKAYFEEKKSFMCESSKYSIIRELIGKGILTDDEVKAILQALRSQRKTPNAITYKQRFIRNLKLPVRSIVST